MNEIDLHHLLFQQLVDHSANVITYNAPPRTERESVAAIFTQLNDCFSATAVAPASILG